MIDREDAAKDSPVRTGDGEPNESEGGDPQRDVEQHRQGRRPAEPDKG